MPDLRMGIAGLGMASRQILPYFEKIPHIRAAAAADIRKESLKAFQEKYAGKVFASVEEMCESPDIDAVWIATPNLHHAEHAIMAAENGKHIICEKPMAVTLEECDRMIEAAERNKVKLLQGHSKIYEPAIKKMCQIVAGGELGRLVQINTYNYRNWILRPRVDVEVDAARGGGIVYNQGPHQTDVVRSIGGGLLKSVRASAGRWDPHFDCEIGYTAFIEFADGTPATMTINGYGYFDITELTWDIGEGGTKVARSPANLVRYKGPVDAATKYSGPVHWGASDSSDGKRYQPFYGLTIVSCERGDIRQSPDGLYVYTIDGVREVPCAPSQGRGAELIELYEALAQDRPVFPDGRWGKATLEVVLAILQSSREKKEIALAHQVVYPS
ncbi:MAG TPA: Gfo/Idh/MocA family oxidoreductase [Candidatus Binatia bacterium]|jgi:phthalate 4,5-cis-dihydrodiol dehydrogenase